MKTATLYQLVDLDTWEVLYIGVTVKPVDKRLYEHMTDKAKPHIVALFQSRRIGAEELRIIPVDERFEVEAAAIRAAASAGAQLMNVHHAGRRLPRRRLAGS